MILLTGRNGVLDLILIPHPAAYSRKGYIFRLWDVLVSFVAALGSFSIVAEDLGPGPQ